MYSTDADIKVIQSSPIGSQPPPDFHKQQRFYKDYRRIGKALPHKERTLLVDPRELTPPEENFFTDILMPTAVTLLIILCLTQLSTFVFSENPPQKATPLTNMAIDTSLSY